MYLQTNKSFFINATLNSHLILLFDLFFQLNAVIDADQRTLLVAHENLYSGYVIQRLHYLDLNA